jgi:hypothetical protein
MNIGDKIKINKGQHKGWVGEINDLYGNTWVAVSLRHRDKRTQATVPPDYIEVTKPATPFAGIDGLWDYYIPDEENA